METNALKQTPFNQLHRDLGGKMVDFSGWDMPVQYTSITQEHHAVRNAAGLFDISHMGQVFVWGAGAEAYLQNLVTNDLRKTPAGKGIYAHLLNEQGGVIDDIFVYRLEENKFLVVLNASRVEVDIPWMRSHMAGFEVELMEAPFAAGLALQGPKAVDILEALSPGIKSLPRNGIAEVAVAEISILVARTGYTGEDGFELFAPAGHLLQVWPKLFEAGKSVGLQPCGLGARDTLRTEVAYPLYGHELDDRHTPFHAGLGWVVKLQKGPFIGREALLQQQSRPLTEKLVGFKVLAGGVARPGASILIDGKEIGTVASGTFGPSVAFALGLAYLPVDHAAFGTALDIHLNGRVLKATVAPTPFYKRT